MQQGRKRSMSIHGRGYGQRSRSSSPVQTPPAGQPTECRTSDQSWVAHGTDQSAHTLELEDFRRRRITERTAHPAEVVDGVELRRQATMDTQELLVHDGGQRKSAERLHAGIVDTFRVLAFACKRWIGKAENIGEREQRQ